MQILKSVLLLSALPFVAMAGNVSVTSVIAQQQYPWNIVDITVTLTGGSNDVANAYCAFAATNTTTKAEISVEHIRNKGVPIGAGTIWTRKFVWDAGADVGGLKIDDVELTVDVGRSVQLWENGPYWAQCNLGATRPEESGCYFLWGDTAGYKRENDGWRATGVATSGFSFPGTSPVSYPKDDVDLKIIGYTDSAGNLVSTHDAATAILGAPWRMPTTAEMQQLVDNCTTTWIMRNGVYGRLLTGKGAYASKSIFLPAAGNVGSTSNSDLGGLGSNGDYWSSTPYFSSLYGEYSAWCLSFDAGSFRLRHYYSSNWSDRKYGRTIRPLRESAQ